MNINWKQLSPGDFEQLCYLILEANKFTDLQWYGKSGGDKGRDIVAKKIDSPLPAVQRETKWIIQCKRYTSRPPSINELSAFLNKCREHKPDNVLLILTNTLNANIKDWLQAVREDYPFDIFVWEEQDLKREIAKHKNTIVETLPNIYSTGEVVLFYEVLASEIVIGCNAMEEVDFLVRNCDNYEEAKQKVKEFIALIKQNEIVFD